MPGEIKTLLKSDTLHQYILDTSVYPREHQQLKELRDASFKKYGQMTVLNIPADEGLFISMLLKIMKAKNTLEIGVFTGYSLLTTALALPDDGQITAVDPNREAFEVGLPFITKAGVSNKINFIQSEALPVLNELCNDKSKKEHFDFVFVDADKVNYLNYHEKAMELVKIGGIIAYDNTLWSGTVAAKEGEVAEDDKVSRKAIMDLNSHLATDTRLDLCLTSIGDGLTLCRRLSQSIN